MRFLFTAPPGLPHLFPWVPLAHAALGAGHSVLVATTGPTLAAATKSGLHVVNIASDQEVVDVYEHLAEVGRMHGRQEIPQERMVAEAYSHFGRISALMLDGLVDVAREWQADVVVYPPAFPAGLLAARAVGASAVLHGFGLRRPMLEPAMHQLVEAKGAHGLTETPLRPDVEINISPESVESMSVTPDSVAPPALAALPMRHCADNGGAQLPTWLLRSGDRPRVAVTLGSITSTDGEGALLAKIVQAAENLDVELVVTPVPEKLPALPSPLPDNVRTVAWLPVSALLPTCTLAVHHGGMGTTYVALAAGVPQLIIPVSGDQPYNAQVPQRLGVGEMLPLADASAESIEKHLRSLLEAPGYRNESTRVAQEMRGLPTPAAVLEQLVELIG